MDSSCGLNFDVQAISLFLATVNQIRVPSDDLLDLVAWYGSTRISPFVTSQGGWRCFRKMIKTPSNSSSSSGNLAQIDQSITMSQFERTIQEVEMGSMVVLNDASDMIESNSTLTGSKTPDMMDSNIQTEDIEDEDRRREEHEEVNEPPTLESEEIDTAQEIKSDNEEDQPALEREEDLAYLIIKKPKSKSIPHRLTDSQVHLSL